MDRECSPTYVCLGPTPGFNRPYSPRQPPPRGKNSLTPIVCVSYTGGLAGPGSGLRARKPHCRQVCAKSVGGAGGECVGEVRLALAALTHELVEVDEGGG